MTGRYIYQAYLKVASLKPNGAVLQTSNVQHHLRFRHSQRTHSPIFVKLALNVNNPLGSMGKINFTNNWV